MKKLKYQILFTILFMTIGIAAVTTNLITNGTTPIASNPDDFNVYINAISENHISGFAEDEFEYIIKNERNIIVNAIFDSPNDFVSLDLHITNASLNYDAAVSYECVNNNEYINISGSTNSTILARSSGGFSLTIQPLKTYVGDDVIEAPISCTINAAAIERTTIGTGDVNDPLKNEIQLISGDGTNLGDEISFAGENFYVISNDGTEAILLTKYNLEVGNNCVYNRDEVTYNCTEIENPSGIQSKKAIGYVSSNASTTGNYGVLPFSDTEYWKNNKGEILSQYTERYVYDENSNLYTYINNYREYLEDLGLSINESRLISFDELEKLGCSYGSASCYFNSEYEWFYSTSYWTGVIPSSSIYIGSVTTDKSFETEQYGTAMSGIRPVIVIPSNSLPKK